MAVLLALLAAAGWGSSDYAAGSASRRSSAVSVVILTHLVAVVALLAIVVDLGPVWTMVVDLAGGEESENGVRWAGPRIAGAPTPADIAWGVAAGLGGGFGAMLLFRGLGKGSMAVVAPITAAGAATIPVVYGATTGEAIGLLGVTGIALALGAIVLVSLGPPAEATGDGTTNGGATDVVTPDAADPGDRADGPGVAPDVEPDVDATVRSDVDLAGGADVALTVPAGWIEQYATLEADHTATGTLRTAEALPAPTASTRVHPGPTPEAQASPPTTASTRVDADLATTVRHLLVVITTLFVALIVAAAGIAAGPVLEILADDRVTSGRAAMLGFALATIAVTGFALRAATPLLRLTSPSATSPARPGPLEGVLIGIRRQPGLTEALLSGVGFGAFFVCIYRAAESAGHWPLVSARATSVVMFTIGALISSTPLLPARGGRVPVLWAGLLDAAAAVFFVLSTRAGLLSVGAVLASLYPAVTVLLARTITKERISGRQMVGLALALGAVGLLAA